MRRTFSTTLAVLLLSVPVDPGHAHGTPHADAVPENAAIRDSYRDMFAASVDEVTMLPLSFVRDPRYGTEVKFEVVESNKSLYMLFLNRRHGAYPIAGAGNWIVKRSLEDGALLQAKIFLQDSEGAFIRLYPGNARTTMDVYLEGSRVYHEVSIRRELGSLLTEPFEDIVDLTQYRVDWSVLVPQSPTAHDARVAEVANLVEGYLPRLSDSDDGALDADGTYRFIDDLSANEATGFNCSGFAKWVVDGLIYPLTDSYLTIRELKEKHVDLRGHSWSVRFEDQRDPYFGLDWTRNLAVALYRAQGRSAESPEAADVRRVPMFVYVEDVGYRLSDLRTVLYLLTRERPGVAYLGSVNRAFGSAPSLRQHVHVVVLFPYFDADGRFRVRTMERNLETDLSSLAERYPGSFVHLVEIPIDGSFEPPAPENVPAPGAVRR